MPQGRGRKRTMELPYPMPRKVTSAARTLIDWLEGLGVDQEGPAMHADHELLHSLVKLHDGNWNEKVYEWDHIRQELERYQRLMEVQDV